MIAIACGSWASEPQKSYGEDDGGIFSTVGYRGQHLLFAWFLPTAACVL
jgi:hypothetical protein